MWENRMRDRKCSCDQSLSERRNLHGKRIFLVHNFMCGPVGPTLATLALIFLFDGPESECGLTLFDTWVQKFKKGVYYRITMLSACILDSFLERAP